MKISKEKLIEILKRYKPDKCDYYECDDRWCIRLNARGELIDEIISDIEHYCKRVEK